MLLIAREFSLLHINIPKYRGFRKMGFQWIKRLFFHFNPFLIHFHYLYFNSNCIQIQTTSILVNAAWVIKRIKSQFFQNMKKWDILRLRPICVRFYVLQKFLYNYFWSTIIYLNKRYKNIYPFLTRPTCSVRASKNTLFSFTRNQH